MILIHDVSYIHVTLSHISVLKIKLYYMYFSCVCRLKWILYRKSYARFNKDGKGLDEVISDAEQDDLFIERIRIENMNLR